MPTESRIALRSMRATTWEGDGVVAWMKRGAIREPSPLMQRIPRRRPAAKPVPRVHAAVARLPLVHADPFDRMIVTRALMEPLRLITHDPVLPAYSDSTMPV